MGLLLSLLASPKVNVGVPILTLGATMVLDTHRAHHTIQLLCGTKYISRSATGCLESEKCIKRDKEADTFGLQPSHDRIYRSNVVYHIIPRRQSYIVTSGALRAYEHASIDTSMQVRESVDIIRQIILRYQRSGFPFSYYMLYIKRDYE